MLVSYKSIFRRRLFLPYTLLSTKFAIPSPGGKLVHRPRLLRILDEGLEQNASLILLCAPAGYGKTTLVSDWLQTAPAIQPGPFAWLTVESGDDHLTRFLTYWITAVQRIRPGFGAAVLQMLQTHKPQPVQALAAMLINELSETPQRMLLILDDFHLLTAQSIQNFMAFLVDHQPPQLCLVLITRADPALPLARLRARGQLVELRQEELCFRPDEAADYLNRMMVPALAQEQVAFLHQQTEGWIAGLHLAAISLREDADRPAFLKAFSGEHAFIASYLTHEVLARLSAPVREFLLQTSILERLSVALCEAVTGQAEAQDILNQLVEANLFILPLDSQRHWYRYHILFADLLQQRLHADWGESVCELHNRASRWFEQNSLLDLAIEHAMAGKAYGQAACLISQVAESLMMRGEASTLLRWLEALPQEEIIAHPILVAQYGLVLFLCSRSPEAVTSLIEKTRSSGDMGSIQGEIAMLQAMVAILKGDTAHALQFSEAALQQIPPERMFFRSMAADSLGMGHTLAGDMPAAMRAFEQVVEISRQIDNLMMTLMALTNLAGLQYMQGQLRLAVDTCRQVIEFASQRIGRQTPILGKTLFNLGEMLREQGDLDAALKYLQESASMMEHFSEIGLPLAYLGITRIYMNRKDWDKAQAFLDRARETARANRSTLMDERIVETMQVRYWIARGELDPALQWARRKGYLDKPPAEMIAEAGQKALFDELQLVEYLTLMRLALAQRQPDRVLELTTCLQALVGRRDHRRRTIELLVLKALALHQKKDLNQALQIIGEAFSLAEPEGYQRVFIDEGELMSGLLYQALAHGVFPAYAQKLLAALVGESQESKLPAEAPAAALIEALSEREREVLGLIAEGLTNGEIAGRLHITLSTVKGHTTNIFGKLGVKNRTQAIARARRMGLLHPLNPLSQYNTVP